jgi:hypothetical protein
LRYAGDFWTDKAEEMHDRARVAWYIAHEVGKKYQKTPPVVWGRVKPWWAPLDLEREAFEVEVAEDVWHAMSADWPSTVRSMTRRCRGRTGAAA